MRGRVLLYIVNISSLIKLTNLQIENATLILIYQLSDLGCISSNQEYKYIVKLVMRILTHNGIMLPSFNENLNTK